VRWIERSLEVGFMARDALGLPDRARFVRSVGGPIASLADEHAGADHDGRKATQHLAGTKPHGL